MKEPKICPKCKETYTEPPALSRIDNTDICPDCGIREALDSIPGDKKRLKEISTKIIGEIKKITK